MIYSYSNTKQLCLHVSKCHNTYNILLIYSDEWNALFNYIWVHGTMEALWPHSCYKKICLEYSEWSANSPNCTDLFPWCVSASIFHKNHGNNLLGTFIKIAILAIQCNIALALMRDHLQVDLCWSSFVL